MDKEFLSFCYLIIIFFSEKSVSETCQELISCLEFKKLLRDNNEKICRVLINESNIRNLNLIEYFTFIERQELINPNYVSIPINLN